MKNKQILLALLTVLTISACSSSEVRRQASGGFEYLEEEPRGELKVPEQLDEPPSDPRYQIPSLGENAHPELVGKNIEVASPRLVIPLVAGSYIEEGTREAKVIFDQVDDSKPLGQTIWDTVLAYLELNDIGVQEFNRDQNVLITDWVIDRKVVDSDWYDISDDYIEHAKKFKLTLDVAPHGRTANLTTEMIEYIDEDGDSIIANKNPQQRRNDEVNFLNYIIAEYDFELRLERSQRIAKIKQGFSSEMGFNPDGEPSFVVDAIYADAWPRIQLVLREMNFVVVDLDQSAGLLFANYVGDSGWFSSILSGNELDIEEGEYRLQIQGVGEKTIVTFKEIDNTSFDIDKVTEIFPVFKETMADDSIEF